MIKFLFILLFSLNVFAQQNGWIDLPPSGGGSGTITSVGLLLPASVFNITGSPVTTTGTLTGSFIDQNANTVFAGPTSGAAATPSFRLLGPSDITGGNINTFAGFDASGNLFSVPEFFINTTSGGMDIALTEQPNNGGGTSVHNQNVNFDPLQNSPNENWNIYNLSAQFDVNNSGFSQGTNGNAAQLLNLSFNHQNTGPIGQLVFENITASIGNGTDPLTTNGLVIAATGINYNANVTLNGGFQGYGFSPNVNAAAIDGTNFYVNAFSDFSNIGITMGSYNSVTSSPSIAGIKNNFNYTGVNINPQITTLNGNAGATGFGFYGTYTTTSATGGIQGVNINPNIVTMGATGYYHGIDINANITTAHGNINGLNINSSIAAGDANYAGINIYPQSSVSLPYVVGINADLNGIPSTTQRQGLTLNGGMLQAYSDYDTSVLPASPGFMNQNALGGLFHVESGSPMTSTLVLANNFGMAAQFDDDMGPDAFGGFLGYVGNGLLSQVAVNAGKTVDTFTGAAIAASVPSIPTSGGTITNANMLTVAGPINGGGTLSVTNLKTINIPSFSNGFAATNAWGLYVADTSLDNWFAKNVVIGGATGKPVGSEALSVTGTAYIDGVLDMNTHQIQNVVDPTLAQDAATKNYVDTFGAVTAVSVATANGFAGSSSGGTTPALTLTTSVTGMIKGNGTAMSAATAGTDYSDGTASLATGILKSTTGTGVLSIAIAADFPTLNQNTTGTAANVTGIVAEANGGTNQSTYTIGDVLYASAANVLSKLGIGSAGQVLTVVAGVPAWQTPSSGANILCDRNVGPSQTYTTIGAAITAASAGDSICIQTGTYAESVTVNKQLTITGSGRGVDITGSLTVTSSGDYSLIQQVKVDSGITIDSGALYVQLLSFWSASGQTITDNGTGSYIRGIQE
jgi:hypothetical protein